MKKQCIGGLFLVLLASTCVVDALKNTAAREEDRQTRHEDRDTYRSEKQENFDEMDDADAEAYIKSFVLYPGRSSYDQNERKNYRLNEYWQNKNTEKKESKNDKAQEKEENKAANRTKWSETDPMHTVNQMLYAATPQTPS